MQPLPITLPVVNSGLWGIDIKVPGGVLRDGAVIKQRLYIALSTTIGSDAFRPTFANDLFSQISRNVNNAIANIKKGIYDAVQLWVPEVKVNSIRHEADTNGKVSFFISYTYNNVNDLFAFSNTDGLFDFGESELIILEGDIPVNAPRFTVSILVNNKPLTPEPSIYGFATSAEYASWANTNLGSKGVFGYCEDKVIAYLNKNNRFAQMSVSQAQAIILLDIAGLPATDIIVTQIKLGSIIDNTERTFDDVADLVDFLTNTFLPANSLTGDIELFDNKIFYTNPEQLQVGFIHIYSMLHANAIAFAESVWSEGVHLSKTIKSAIDRLCLDLHGVSNNAYVTYDIWDKFIALYPFVGGEANSHKYNLVDARNLDAAGRLTFYGSPTHSSTGVKFNGSTQYANTHVKMKSHGIGAASLHLSIYNRIEKASISAASMGVGGPNANDYALLFVNAGNMSVCLAQNLNVNRTVTSVKGFSLASRINTSTIKTLNNIDGLASHSRNVNGDAPDNEMYLGSMNDNGVNTFYGNDELAFVSMGAGLTDAEMLALQLAINAFETTIGRNV